MFHFEAGPNRWKSGFKEAVLKNFRFLYKYRFRCVRAEPTFVRYETLWPLSRKSLFVNVYHDRGHDMEVAIGQGCRGGLTLPLPWIVKWAGGKEAQDFEKHAMFQASSPEGVWALMPKLAGLVRKYAAPFLRGDEEAYRRAGEQMLEEGAFHAREEGLRLAREKAEAAWHAKDYKQVVSLYEPFQEDLTRSERMRLDYAKKQVSADLRP